MSLLRAPSGPALRVWGFVVAAASVVLASLPLGPLFAQPPMPLAVLWAAYGWASEDASGFGAPIMLVLLGLLHDQLAGGPYGLFVVVYLSVYLGGRVAAVLMSAPNLVSLWGGFIVTAFATVLLVMAVNRLLFPIAVMPYAEAVAITAIVFPLVRPLFVSGAPASRPQPGARR